ncbi:MAG TPA: hypothetical protein V6C52_08100 [Coleofasciculaceae cyanobacterium]
MMNPSGMLPVPNNLSPFLPVMPSTPLPAPPGMWPVSPGTDSFAFSPQTQPEQPEELPALPLLGNVNLRDMAYTNQLLENTQYGLDLRQLLTPGSGFKAEYRNGQVMLDLPPSTVSPQGQQQGSAEELCRLVGNQLQRVMGNQYEFRLAEGFCGEYFIPEVGNNHTFLLMTPRLNPAEQVIIDPALKRTGRIELLPQYSIRALKPLPSQGQSGPATQAIFIPPVGYAEAIPLGFAEDLMPGTAQIPAKALLYLTFEMKNGIPSVVLAAQTSPRGLVLADPHIYNCLKPDDVLSQFLNRVQADLRGGFSGLAQRVQMPALPSVPPFHAPCSPV